MQQSQNQVPCSTQHPWTSGDESEVRDVHQQEGGLEQRLLRVALKETTASDRPALEAVLRLYQFLYRSVAHAELFRHIRLQHCCSHCCNLPSMHGLLAAGPITLLHL
jgi:hypothetical protein